MSLSRFGHFFASPRLFKIYTRTGDQGSTFLNSQTERLPKQASIFHVLGDIDELSSSLAYFAVCFIVLVVLLNHRYSSSFSVAREFSKSDSIRSDLLNLQHRLQDVNSILSASSDQAFVKPLLNVLKRETEAIEGQIDGLTEKLAPLRNFIIPSGGQTASLLHLSRSICRRAERSLCDYLSEDLEKESESKFKIKDVECFINRLSDYLFTLARYCALIEGHPEIPYSSRKAT